MSRYHLAENTMIKNWIMDNVNKIVSAICWVTELQLAASFDTLASTQP